MICTIYLGNFQAASGKLLGCIDITGDTVYFNVLVNTIILPRDGRLTADPWGSPGHTGSCFIAGSCIRCHCSAEALTVSTTITGTRVTHARIIKWRRIHLVGRDMQIKHTRLGLGEREGFIKEP